ncbi:class I SAM-dependent methyltransferase [Paenibacillus sp. 19GGS1-52]|uniref:class I SAM-dependent methyltransferase n=1 Tax=Paenibacillus sp. 19GGS1-52 TaxID=2758563 RepID=UPI001EFB5D53|nr:class I SAM-dependent methyltransferase [Paenibacillus sp. 19GGS1-52]ULO05508.1 class I SAM-dependent methyltransferase [Paenibacillus sp. 19GGS1-52]
MAAKDYGLELFKGTAAYYSRYRPLYPSSLVRYLVDQFALDGTGRMLDLGCGSGQLALRFTDWFQQIMGMDTEPEMLDEAKRLATESRVDNIQWLNGKAEDITAEFGEFRLVTIAKAFHWMDRGRVLELLYNNVASNGGIAIIDNSLKKEEPQIWQQKVNEVVRRWLGEERKAGNSTYTPPAEKYEDILSRSPFKRVESHQLPCYTHIWTIDSIIGNLYSTSFASRRLFGNNVDRFETDLRQTLYDFSTNGLLKEVLSVDVIRAYKE